MLLLTLHIVTFLFGLKEAKEYSAMDYIIKANMGKEHLMNVYKVDIRPPSYKSGAGAGQLNAAARQKTRLWTGGVIPYIIDATLHDRPGYVVNLKKAIKEWETYTCLNFRPYKTTDRDYVAFGHGVGCNADVGRKGGRQQVTLGHGCSDPSVITHEIGHVVGFWHEQNRPDRDKYVKIKWDNIKEGYEFAFYEYTTRKIDSRGVPYDYKSIMHYGNSAFTKNARETIVAKVQGVGKFGNTNLSPLDIKQANMMYNCPATDKVFPQFPNDFTITRNGTISGQHCLLIIEPLKKRRRPVWLCHKLTKQPTEMEWSHNGTIKDMDCTHISSPFGDDRHGLWDNNYLCVPKDSVYKFQWSKNASVIGLRCLKWSIYNAYLCAKTDNGAIDGGWTKWSNWTKCSQKCDGGYKERRRYCTNPVPKNYGKPCKGVDYRKRYCNMRPCSDYPTWPDDFFFGHFTHTPNHNCIRIYDRTASTSWNNHYFCSSRNKRNILMKWSDMGPTPAMICTKIDEPRERRGWSDNYLCIPHTSKYRFEWSHSGPTSGLECVEWRAKNGTDGWNDNYLCSRRLQMKADPGLNAAAHNTRVVVDGGWSKWSNWSECSQSCDKGYQSRSRSCTQPTPSSNGRDCSGRKTEVRKCTVTDCPKPCFGDYSGDTGALTSPQFPKYPQNAKCRWTITVPNGKRVEVKFTQMHLKGPRSSCTKDYLLIRDGDNKARILKQYCDNSNTTQTIHSTGNKMLLELTTTDALVNGGFKARWISSDNCHKTFTAVSGSIMSPSYPAKYPNDMDCRWLVKVPLSKVNPLTHTLKLKFDKFHLEHHRNCSYDRLEIFNGKTERSPKQTFCGTKTPVVPLTAFTNNLLIKFKSDHSRNYDGFKLSWYIGKRN